MTLGPTLVRGLVGPLFMGHGAQKLWGKFGGHGLDGTGGFFESLGLSPGRKHAQAAGLAEFTGGALLTAGALTPVGATLVSSTMMTAIRKVHASKGPWVTEGGWEYNGVLIAAATALAETGPGAVAVDNVLFPWMRGKRFAVASLLAAAAGSALATSGKLPGTQADARETDQVVHGDPAAAEDDSRFTRDDAAVESPAQAS